MCKGEPVADRMGWMQGYLGLSLGVGLVDRVGRASHSGTETFGGCQRGKSKGAQARTRDYIALIICIVDRKLQCGVIIR